MGRILHEPYTSCILLIIGMGYWVHMMKSSNGNIFRVTGHLCGDFTGPRGEFPAQRPVIRSFDVFFDLRLGKSFSKQSWGWWFEMPLCQLWRQFNAGFSLILDSSVSLSAGIRSDGDSDPETLGSNPAFSGGRHLVTSLLPVHQN